MSTYQRRLFYGSLFPAGPPGGQNTTCRLSDRQVAPSRTQLEESRASYLKLRINRPIFLCVCVSITRHSHTHTRLKRQRCKICSTLKHGPGKTAEPQTNGSQDRDGILEYWQRWKKKTQKDGANERGRSLPIRQAKNSFACLRWRSSGCETPGEALFEFHWCRNQKK